MSPIESLILSTILKINIPQCVKPGSHVWSKRKSKSNTSPVHTREIVKQAQAQERVKGKITFSLFLRLLHTCEPGFMTHYNQTVWLFALFRPKYFLKMNITTQLKMWFKTFIFCLKCRKCRFRDPNFKKFPGVIGPPSLQMCRHLLIT